MRKFKFHTPKFIWSNILGTRAKAHSKLQSIKDYIGFPKEILNNTLIEDLYDGIEVSNDTFYQNSINMGKWSIKYAWSKLREQIDKTDWKRHANPAVVNAYYSGIENSIQFPAGILQVQLLLSRNHSVFRYFCKEKFDCRSSS